MFENCWSWIFHSSNSNKAMQHVYIGPTLIEKISLID